MPIKKIAFFASGSGSNIENIVNYFRNNESEVRYLILCNKPDAFVLERAKKLQIETILFDRKAFCETDIVLKILKEFKPDLVVLAGFLWLMPVNIINEFSGRIINIHPALLPKHGGKGMYGMHVHNAVVKDRDKESGITIHYVNEHYDEGAYILQVPCTIAEKDTAEDVAQKVHQLEYEYFPKVIQSLL